MNGYAPLELLTIAELAALSKESRRTIERRIAAGELEVIHLSRRAVRITPESAARYLHSAEESTIARNTHPIEGGRA